MSAAEDATGGSGVGPRADRFIVQSRPDPLAGAGLAVAERITVRFTGEGAGEAALSWGQMGLWDAMRRQRSWLPLGAVSRVPEGATLADLAGELRFMMSRHPTLRTRLRLDPDGPRQVVAGGGELPLEIVDVPGQLDPGRVAEHLMRRYCEAPFDVTTDWPVRMGVVRHRGRPRLKVVVICHLATDATGAAILTDELADPALVTGRVARPLDSVEPLEQARWQSSPVGQAQNAASLRYCARVLRAAPSHRFPPPARPRRPRYWFAEFTSPALYQAMRAVAAATGSDTATVLLALYAVANARVTGLDPVLAMVLASNRYRRGLAGTISPVAQAIPCAITVGTATFAELVAQTRGRTLAAYKASYHDPVRFNELVARLSRERGEAIDTACYVNDRRGAYRDPPLDSPPAPAGIAAARRHTRLAWRLRQDEAPYERFFLHVEQVPETVAISVVLDTAHVDPADAEAVLFTMEQAAVTAAADPHRSVATVPVPAAPAVTPG